MLQYNMAALLAVQLLPDPQPPQPAPTDAAQQMRQEGRCTCQKQEETVETIPAHCLHR